MFNMYYKFLYSPMPSNIYYWWNFGSLLGFTLLVQIISGLFLSMFYENNVGLAFDSVMQIERNINLGWLLRSIHANGASMFFIFIYLHIGRGLFFKSFYLVSVWMSGMVILLLLFMEAFIGYVLPWGQMSFWGATVITNLLSSIPYIGVSMTVWLWGGFSVDNSTLMRFFSFHFLIPFVMLGMIFLHIIFLHNSGSSSPLGNSSKVDKIPFQPYFLWKDILGILFSFLLFLIVVYIFPVSLMDADNFIPANPLSTPAHIQPEWYFLFAYAILRTVPNKLGGVLVLMMSILIFMFLVLVKEVKYKKHIMSEKIFFKCLFFFWVINFLNLTILGAMPIEMPYIYLAQISSVIYFMFFFIFI